jgi:ATP-dependent Lon protease
MTRLKMSTVIACCFPFTLELFAAQTFDVEKVKQEIFSELSKNLKCNKKNNPILILVGGYPGAGKTTE